jgi:hypothetical protein
LDIGSGGDRKVFFGGSGGKCDCGPYVVGSEGWEVGEDVFRRIARCEAGQDCPEEDARALKYRLSAADSGISNDALRKWMVVCGFSSHKCLD